MNGKFFLIATLLLINLICIGQIDITILIDSNGQIQISPSDTLIRQDLGPNNTINVNNKSTNEYLLVLQGISTNNPFNIELKILENKNNSYTFDTTGKPLNIKGLPMRIILFKISLPKNIKLKTIIVDTQNVSPKPPVKPDKITKNPKAMGIAFYDTYGLLGDDSTGLKKEILQYYNGQNTSPDTGMIRKAYETNPYLDKMVRNWLSPIKATQGNSPLSFKKFSFNSIMGLEVTNYADGIAKFLVGRMKEELSLAFFEKFKETLNDKQYPELRVLFPQTTKNLKTIDKDIYQFSSYINILRESFIKDLNNEYSYLQELLRLPKYKDYFYNKEPELGSIFSCSFYIINSLSKGKHPGDVLANFNTNDIKLCNMDNCGNKLKIQNTLKASIQGLQLISSSLRSKSETHYWIPTDSVQMLVTNHDALKIYLGLIYQNIISNPAIYGEKNSFGEILKVLGNNYDSLKDSITRYEEFFLTFIDKAQEINDNIIDLGSRKKSEIDFNEYYNLFNSTIDLIEYSTSVLDLPYVNSVIDQNIQNQVKSVSNIIIDVSRSTGELFVDVKTKNYPSAIINSVNILDKLLNFNDATYKSKIKTEYNASLKILRHENSMNKSIRKAIDSQIDDFKIDVFKGQQVQWSEIKYAFVNNAKIPNNILTTDIQNQILNIINLKINLQNATYKDQLRKYILKYGSFIANVAQAKNSDDVKNAIESIALPTGSYSVKRNSKWNFALNGYMGYGYDWGNPWGLNQEGRILRDTLKLTWNVSAPVGVSISKGICSNKKYPSSLSLFLSIIDVGSIANFRLNGDTTVLKRTITLSDVFSPGISFIIGIPKTPLCFTMGCIYKPQLIFDNKKSEFGGVPGMLRFNASLLVDIPIVNIKTTEY